MLDSGANQGFNLRSLIQEVQPHAVAMASHGEQDAELPLLWDLCSTYVRLGYSVAVLDGTTSESETNPGLDQLLDYVYWRSDDKSDQPSWSVLPAAQGFKRLCGASGHVTNAMEQLASALQTYNVILVYAKADTLLSLLPDSGLKPLLVVSSEGLSRLSAYKALKQMLLNGRLQPSVVSIVPDSAPEAERASAELCKNLQECAMTFMGHQLDTVTLRLERRDGRVQIGSMHTFALRMLENATPLQRQAFGKPSGTATGQLQKWMGVH
jgi:hypothetical protein